MILCCGEALIDMLNEEEQVYKANTGGAAFNTAIALGRLDLNVGLLSGISQDSFGQKIMADLQKSQVDTGHTIRSERPTTLAFAELSNGDATYSFFDENSAGRMIKTADFPQDLSHITTLYFGGISLVCEPVGSSFLELAHSHSKNKVIMLDPNIRPAFIQEEKPYRMRIEQMMSLANIIKVSQEDLDWLYPNHHSLEDKIKILQSMDTDIVILTKGKSGASAWMPDGQCVNVAGQPVKVVDTVGAGDTFNAGILAYLQKMGYLEKNAIKNISKQDLISALTFGAKISAISVSREGANPPWKSELA